MEVKINQEFDDSVSRRKDPNYAQVSGYIDKNLAMRFKIACTATEVSQTDALEQAVALWLEKYEQPVQSKTKASAGVKEDQ